MLKHHIVHEKKRLEIAPGDFLIGRSSNCHLVLDDPSVSRVHASIVNSEGKLRIDDKGSRNGVIVNGERIPGSLVLTHGDNIAIGHQKMKIESLENQRDSDRTVGIRSCDVCGNFANANEPFCANCGNNIGVLPSAPPENVLTRSQTSQRPPSAKESIVMEQQPMGAMAGLALKALQVGKHEEAELLIGGALRTALEKLKRNTPITDHGFLTLSKALLEYAASYKSSEHVSALFNLHLAAQRLMTRDVVENLYNTVKKASYLACSDMGDYLAYLETVKDSFSPGERFVHRRLTGLVKICS